MSVEVYYQEWWESLSPRMQTEAVEVADVVPDWMARDLDSYEIVVVHAELAPGPRRVALMTTRLREFLAGQRRTVAMA